VFRVTGAAGVGVAGALLWGAALLAAAEGARLLGLAVGAGVVDAEQAVSPIATVAKSARILRAPA
jgi:hypothetical protein